MSIKVNMHISAEKASQEVLFSLLRMLFSDPKVLVEKLKGHADAVWSIAYHSSDNRLVSASADGTIKLWEPGWFLNVEIINYLF